MSMEIANQHVALLCSPGMGHLIPVLELGKRLVTHQNFTVTIFFVPSQTSAAESELLDASAFPRGLDIIKLPSPDVSCLLHPDAAVVTRLAEMMRQVRPAFRAALHDMINFRHRRRPTVLIVDLFGTESLPIAEELGIPKYVYIASNAWFLSVMIYSPTLDEQVKGEFNDLKDPLQIPGCRQLSPELDIVDALLDRSNQQYDEHMLMGRGIPKGDGILINIWEELEPKTLAALRDEKFLARLSNGPVFHIGPLLRPKSSGSSGDVLGWLDEQPNESVIYVSFGSGGALSYEQMVELAWGLEMSRQRFVWVIRSPIVTSADEAFFTAGSHGGDVSNPIRYLPKGFLNRTKNIGLVIPLWASQVDILAHPSVGGFLTHCGWNSVLESITNGVPMIAWPLYAEQRLNATLLTEELGLAVRSKIPPWKNVVEREEIEEMVRKIMEDKEGFALRDRAKNLKFSGAKALEQGGSSHNALSQFTKHAEMFLQFANGVVPPSQVP